MLDSRRRAVSLVGLAYVLVTRRHALLSTAQRAIRRRRHRRLATHDFEGSLPLDKLALWWTSWMEKAKGAQPDSAGVPLKTLDKAPIPRPASSSSLHPSLDPNLDLSLADGDTRHLATTETALGSASDEMEAPAAGQSPVNACGAPMAGDAKTQGTSGLARSLAMPDGFHEELDDLVDV